MIAQRTRFRIRIICLPQFDFGPAISVFKRQDDPAYPLKLFQRVITVSLEMMKIARGLPKLEIA